MTQKKPPKSLQELTLLNRFLFAEAMEIPENMKIVLDIVLEDDILLADVPQAEKELRKSTLYRYAKLDVWAKDIFDTVYDTEVQAQDTNNLPKRTRYYQAMIDSKLLKPGDIDFNNLNRSVIIMITPFDLFGYGLYRYTFVGQCLEVPGLKLEDDATRIFLNTRGTNDSDVSQELVQLLHYIENTNDQSLELGNHKLLQLQKNVKSVQDNAEVGVRYMQLWEEFEYERRAARAEGRETGWHEGRQAGLAEGRQAGLAEGRQTGLAEGRQAGLAEGRQEIILEYLNELGNMPESLKEKITSENNQDILKSWVKLAVKVTSVQEFENAMG